MSAVVPADDGSIGQVKLLLCVGKIYSATSEIFIFKAIAAPQAWIGRGSLIPRRDLEPRPKTAPTFDIHGAYRRCVPSTPL